MIKPADINDSQILDRTVAEPHPTNANLARLVCAWPGLEEPITSDYGAIEALRAQMLKWVEGCRASIVDTVNAAEEEQIAKRRRDAAMTKPTTADYLPGSVAQRTPTGNISAEGFARQRVEQLTSEVSVLERRMEELAVTREELVRWKMILEAFTQKNAPDTGGGIEGEEPQHSAASGDI